MSYINNWPASQQLKSSTPVQSSGCVAELTLRMFIEEMVAVRSQQGEAARLEEKGEQEAYRRWQEYNSETIIL